MNDPRVIRTRRRLRAALVEACVSRPLDQVSVSEITRRAGVGRATFYLHYDDLHALAIDTCADLVREAVDAVHAGEGQPRPDHPPPALSSLFTSVRDRAALYRSLLRPGGGGPLGELLHRELMERSRSERERRLPESRAHAPVASAVASAFIGVLADWVHERFPGEPDEVSALVWRLLCAIHAAFLR